jgi:hypothetical protein
LKTWSSLLFLFAASTLMACALIVGIEDHRFVPGATLEGGGADGSDLAGNGGPDSGVGACGDGGTSLALSFSSPADLLPFVVSTQSPNPGPLFPPDAGMSLVRASEQGSRDTIWFVDPVSLDSFDVTFEALVTCGIPCGDGAAFVWLDTTSVDGGFAGSTGGGSTFGIPSKLGGSAVAVDLIKGPDPRLNDPDPPGLEIIQLDGGQPPGQYPWSVNSQGPLPALSAPAWYGIAISVRGGHVVVIAAGTKLEADVAPRAYGVFGITAAGGSAAFSFNIRNLRASFGCGG